jgi:transposase
MKRVTLNEPKKIERQIDNLISSDREGRFIYRLCSLKMFLNDPACTTESLGKLMQTSPGTIANWINWINVEGTIDILRDRDKPGRNSTLNEVEMKHLRDQIQKQPTESGLDANLWDGKSLSHYIKKKFGKELKVRQCQRIFNKLGFRLKRGRTMVAKSNPEDKKALKKTSDDSKKRKL